MKSTSIAGKTIRVAAVIAACAMMLGACGNPAASQDATDTSAAGYWPKPTADLKGTQLTFWTSPQAKNIPTQVIKDFEKTTHAKINLVTIPEVYENNAQTKITTGDVPDMAFWQPTRSMLAGFVAQNKLQKLDNAPFIKNYRKGMADSGGLYNKTRYAVMVSAPSTIGVYYNKDVFSQAGLTSVPDNWDELVADAQKIKNAHVDGVQSPLFEMGGSQWGTQWAVQAQLAEATRAGFYTRLNKNEEKLTGRTFMTAIENYKKLFSEGLYNTDAGSAKDTEQESALWSGKTGMIFGNASQFLAIAALANDNKQAIDKKIGYFPISSKGTITTLIPDGSSGIVAFRTGDSTKEAAARQFINFWMSTDYKNFVQQQNIVSALKTVSTPATVPQAAIDASNSIANSVGSLQSEAIANPDLYVNLANMVNGTMTPEQVAKTTQDQFAQVAKAQGAQGF
ncbi:MAG: extracellular solute-binding protein [Bifidobacterium sp.]|jgi:raffinose/stachyose/melibiose transport system substrate-binding protein|nr:extracellular solute-binding protein [Bifidobacterium sp.]